MEGVHDREEEEEAAVAGDEAKLCPALAKVCWLMLEEAATLTATGLS